MAIKLNVVKSTDQGKNALVNGYLYKDILFDLKLSYTDNSELFKIDEKKDIAPIYDAAAVINSVKNILTTTPGQKLLNPTFGIDLRSYLFEPVTETYGFFLGKDIYNGITLQENRVKIDKVRVTIDIDNQEYQINLRLSIPSLNINGLSLKGVLNNDGYTFV